MKQVVINNCFGGFGLSPLAVKRYAELSGFNVFGYVTDYQSKDFDRTIRWNEGDKDICIYWIKKDIGDLPSKEVLNNADWFHERDIKRDDENLIKVIKELKKKANTRFSDLRIVKIPNDVEWQIEEYDGNEHVSEKHRTWS